MPLPESEMASASCGYQHIEISAFGPAASALFCQSVMRIWRSAVSSACQICFCGISILKPIF